jgi:selenocysteine-specific elongation factor
LVEGQWVLTEKVAGVTHRALEVVADHHEDHPADPGIPIATLRRALGPNTLLGRVALTDLTESGALEVDRGLVKLPGFEARVAGGDAAIDTAVDVLNDAGLSPPSVAELGIHMGRNDIGDILRLAAAAGRVVAVERERYYASSQLDTFASLLREIGAAGEITPGSIRERLGLSRKFLIPLLEWSDRANITRRVGGARVLSNRDTIPRSAST